MVNSVHRRNNYDTWKIFKTKEELENIPKNSHFSHNSVIQKTCCDQYLKKTMILALHLIAFCLRAFWFKGYQRGSLGKSHQNGDYLKQAKRKSYPFATVIFGENIVEAQACKRQNITIKMYIMSFFYAFKTYL